ncbi:MAG: Sjogren's syndrome/scleroderma autoantigen 1 family protein [Candidatus Bathyarchaeia archaeon]
MSEELKRIADLLKSGATMLSDTCPVCHTPLFMKDDKIFCPKCNKPVIIISSPEEEQRLTTSIALSNLEQTILQRLEEANAALKIEKDLGEILKVSSTISLWLTILEKIRRLK